MSLLFDRVPKDPQRRKEVAIFLLEARQYHNHNREHWKIFCRGMAMMGWLEEHKHILATADEFAIPI